MHVDSHSKNKRTSIWKLNSDSVDPLQENGIDGSWELLNEWGIYIDGTNVPTECMKNLSELKLENNPGYTWGWKLLFFESSFHILYFLPSHSLMCCAILSTSFGSKGLNFREKRDPHPALSLFPSFSLPDVLCDSTDLVWRKGTPFESMTDRTVPTSDGLLAEVFWGFPQLWGRCQENSAQSPGSFHYHSYH